MSAMKENGLSEDTYKSWVTWTKLNGKKWCDRSRKTAKNDFLMTELTRKTMIPVVIRISLIIKTLDPDKSNPK